MARFTRADVIGTVWNAAADGEWHLRRSLIDHISFEPKEILAALDFLVKYGFAQSATLEEEAFRMITNGPSPMEAAEILRILRHR